MFATTDAQQYTCSTYLISLDLVGVLKFSTSNTDADFEGIMWGRYCCQEFQERLGFGWVIGSEIILCAY